MTTKYAASVTWGKESIEVQLDPTAGVSGLKSELQARTGVPMERMKVMAKSKGLWKGVLKDEEDLTSVRKTVFLEDLPPEEAARMVGPSGLVNLGNTCYLNGVTQCLCISPQLRNGLKHYSPGGGDNNNRQMQMCALSLEEKLVAPLIAHLMLM